MMKLKDVIHSTVDRTQKLIFLSGRGQVLEVSYIDKQDGKHILCVPTQTNCAMACKFCHTTDLRGKIAVDDLNATDIRDVVAGSLSHLGLSEDKERTLLISYMGNGEPLENIREVVESMLDIRELEERHFKVVRFAVSTMMPHNRFTDLAYLGETVKSLKLNVKLHFSLHFTADGQRREWMPMASGITPSLHMLKWYQELTGNAVEVHYTPIADVNDGYADTLKLIMLLKGRDIPIKFLKFSPMSSGGGQPSSKVPEIVRTLEDEGIVCEDYDPPGRDVGASCGMFLADYYLKYSSSQLVDIR